jgi:hypothetical protein
MGFFTPRERRELERPGEIAEFAPARRVRIHELADNNTGSMQRLTQAPLQRIDDLIAELHMRREKLLSESARVQRELIEYAKLNQSTMASTNILAEALSNWRKAPGTFSESEPSVPEADMDGDDTPVAPDATPTAPHDSDADGELANRRKERSDFQG